MRLRTLLQLFMLKISSSSIYNNISSIYNNMWYSTHCDIRYTVYSRVPLCSTRILYSCMCVANVYSTLSLCGKRIVHIVYNPV